MMPLVHPLSECAVYVGSITQVAFYVNSTQVAVKTTIPYAYTYSANVPGPLSAYAVASDNRGVTSTTAVVTFNVNPVSAEWEPP